jgi:Holliday junction DNA helicase RuvA
MLAFIRGLLLQSSPLFVIIEAQGIGYKIFIPTNLFPKLPQIETSLLLHTSFIVREFSQSLYGFLAHQERDLFEALLNVTGIGPKIALSLIGHMDVHDLYHAISQHDITTISKVPGIGKKTAERLIIEMRDKMANLYPSLSSGTASHIQIDPRTQIINDAMSTLINLGYNQITAQKAIKKTLKEASPDIKLAHLITEALKHT